MSNIKSALYTGVGRRKCSNAKVYVIPGIGNILVNKKPLSNYFNKNQYLIDIINFPLELLGLLNKYDLVIFVKGGGFSGQADAIKLALSKALCQLEPDNRKIFKSQGLLKTDSRIVERKKYGLKKARKASQYSKR